MWNLNKAELHSRSILRMLGFKFRPQIVMYFFLTKDKFQTLTLDWVKYSPAKLA